jgi:hypothetical protein
MDNEKRAYLRGNCFCVAEIIVDQETGESEEISVIDLAAGGLKFTADGSNSEYRLGEIYLLKLAINESDVNIDDILTNIKICRTELSGSDVHIYGAAFRDLTTTQSIRIDEIIQHKKRMLKGI